MNKDFIEILREIRGSAVPGQPVTDGIWYELTIADKNGNPGIYGDILAKYGIVTESAGTFDQAVALLENLNVEVTTLPAGSTATSALVNGVWQIGIPRGINGIDGNEGITPELTMTYDSGNIKYTVSVDGVVVTNTNLLNLDTLVDSKVSTNVGVQETLEAKQEVIDKVGEAQGLVDSLNQSVVIKKQEISDLTEVKKQEILDEAEVQSEFVRDVGEKIIQEFDEHALHRVNQYDSNHSAKLDSYNENDSIKIAQYNENHVERLENINYAYADRIVEMIKTRNFMGIMDEYVAQTDTHMINFLDTTDANYIYYANGTLLALGVDYTVYDETTIELVVKANPYDVIVQVNTQILSDILTAEGALFDYMIGAPDGVAGLDSSGLVPSSQLPSYVDDVLEFETKADLPLVGESGKIYVVIVDETESDETITYRWSGSAYIKIADVLDGNEIAALYEGLADTNKYTDAEKAKLADTETTTQLDSRDTANRDRTNHTGTQSLDTVTETTDKKIMTDLERTKLAGIEEGATADQTKADIDALGIDAETVNGLTVETAVPSGAVFTDTVYDDTAVNTHIGDATVHFTQGQISITESQISDFGNYELADVTILKDADIGVSVQAYDVNTVIDAAYVATEENYTTIDKTKVENIPGNTNLVLGTATFTRYDKILGSMDIMDMVYSDGNLSVVRYVGDNDTDLFYRDVLTYSYGDLVVVKHYYGTTDTITESGVTTLVYDVDKNLVGYTYTEV